MALPYQWSFPALIQVYRRLLHALPAVISQAVFLLPITTLFFVHERVVVRVGYGRVVGVNGRVR
ncbi:hypothetical protein D3C73_1585190 [compost metagenome]